MKSPCLFVEESSMSFRIQAFVFIVNNTKMLKRLKRRECMKCLKNSHANLLLCWAVATAKPCNDLYVRPEALSEWLCLFQPNVLFLKFKKCHLSISCEFLARRNVFFCLKDREAYKEYLKFRFWKKPMNKVFRSIFAPLDWVGKLIIVFLSVRCLQRAAAIRNDYKQNYNVNYSQCIKNFYFSSYCNTMSLKFCMKCANSSLLWFQPFYASCCE